LSTDGSGTYSFANAATGDVSISGTPVANQIAIWTDASTIKGDATLSIDNNHEITLYQPRATTPPTDSVSYNIGGGNTSVHTGLMNTGFGWHNLNLLTTANYNSAFGSNCLLSVTSGSFNTAVGSGSGQNIITSSQSTSIGYEAMKGTTIATMPNGVGGANTAIGYRSLKIIEGAANTAIGYQSGVEMTTGSKNVIIGSFTGFRAAVVGGLPEYSIIASSNNIVLSDGDGNVRQSFDSTGTASFSGNVGIGIASPTLHNNGRALHIHNSGGNSAELHLTDNTSGSASGDGSVIHHNGANLYIQNHEAGVTQFYNSGSLALSISSGGAATFSTGANRTLIIGKDSVDTGYNVVSLNGTTTKGSYSGIAGGGTSDNNLYLNSANNVVVQTGSGFSPKLTISSTGAATFSGDVEVIKSSTPTIQLTQSGATNYKGYIKLAGNDLEIRGSSGVMEFYNGSVDGNSSALRMSISSGGTVSIGSSTATNPLSIRTANGESYLRFLNADGTSYGDLERSITGNGAVRITTPYFRVTGTLETQLIQSALGIVFNNNSVTGNKTSVTLNAYEEGTWTPSPNFSTTNAFSSLTSSGTYTRVGRLVTATLIMSFEKGSSAGNFTITGLPFTVINTTDGSGRSGFSVSYLQRIGQADKIFTAYATENTTTIQPYFTGQLSSATVISVAATDISTDTASVVGTITYQVKLV
jgi:hypothetical protein